MSLVRISADFIFGRRTIIGEIYQFSFISIDNRNPNKTHVSRTNIIIQ